MPIINLNQVKENMESIFNEASDVLENIINQYRDISIGNEDDPLHEVLFTFCDEMETVKRKINDHKLKFSERIEAVGDAGQFIKDFIDDTNEVENSSAGKINTMIDKLESKVGLNPDNVIENDILTIPQEQHIKYFKDKKAELEKILADNPQLMN